MSADNTLFSDLNDPRKASNLTITTATYIVSDLHLGNTHFHRDNFLKWLDALPEDAHLVLNGDIVDKPEDALPPDDEAVLERLIVEAEGRCVTWLHGNHDADFVLDRPSKIEFVERWSVEDQLLVVHGDQLDGVMPKHGVFKAAFNALHKFRIRLGFPDVHVAHYAKKWGFLYRVLNEHVTRRAVAAAEAEGFAAITCGHTHAPMDVTHRGCRYLNTGAWTEEPHHFVTVEDSDISFHVFASGRA
ncbi:MAG: metallophosphoesterase [Candidatus Latescibacterota bacterium]|nr:metallophosphoesterase [Candidatus Latescibacterota bacterium]